MAGTGTDFTIDVNVQVMNILLNGWPAAGAQGDPDLELFDINSNLTGVKIGDLAKYDGTTFYQVHVRPNQVITGPFTIGSSMWKYEDIHDVHVWAKGENGKDKKRKMEQEVQQQLLLVAAAPGNGLQWLKITAFKEVPESPEEWRFELVHSVASVSCFYYKCKVPSGP